MMICMCFMQLAEIFLKGIHIGLDIFTSQCAFKITWGGMLNFGTLI